MIVRYGSYKLPSNETEVSITRTPMVDAAKRTWGYEEQWELRGRIPNPDGDKSALESKLAALEAAFASGGKVLDLLLPDGTTRSKHVLGSGQGALTRCKIVRPVSYPEGRGPAYATERRFTVGLSALYSVDGADRVVSFSERLRFVGGGPAFGFLFPARGAPIKQLRKQATTFKATQSGSAVGLFSRPSPPPPIWPQHFKQDTSMVVASSPRRNADFFMEYGIEWNYDFESATPMYGTPNLWL